MEIESGDGPDRNTDLTRRGESGLDSLATDERPLGRRRRDLNALLAILRRRRLHAQGRGHRCRRAELDARHAFGLSLSLLALTYRGPNLVPTLRVTRFRGLGLIDYTREGHDRLWKLPARLGDRRDQPKIDERSRPGSAEPSLR